MQNGKVCVYFMFLNDFENDDEGEFKILFRLVFFERKCLLLEIFVCLGNLEMDSFKQKLCFLFFQYGDYCDLYVFVGRCDD